ncbi:MAG: hypothetical protein COV44_00580 [Deltaproteobacteria bacterium CG11_big_fil_rev_8_21_14_0_20_45_16]|nr:MAG: hypothetical protein COV44_00580 [Deltaproteobacteria bacterium CG11_big_fil_rev_8_21_14_0_20_45_16]
MMNEDFVLPAFENTRVLNFAESGDRQKMERALADVHSKLGQTYRLEDATIITQRNQNCNPSFNPAQIDQVVGYVEYANLEQSLTALDKVHRYSKTWKKTEAKTRIQLVEKLADILEAKRFELSAWMVFEVGKNWREADADVCEAIDFCRYYARQMLKLSKPHLTQVLSGERDELSYHPKGVGLVIAPWNFPLAILTGMTVASLVSGNATLFKPAEQSSVIGAMLARAIKEAGFPEGSFYFLAGEGEKIGPSLVADERVDVIAFTGSASVGLSIIETAAKKPGAHQRGVKKVIAEMGGKNAVIVDEDADIDEAILGCVHSAFSFQGQKCSALSRLLVHENVYDSFVSRFVEAAKTLRMGPGANPENQLGPVIDSESQTRIEKTIAEAEKRLKLLYKKTDLPTGGHFVPLAIFETQDTKDPIFQNEIFGPVVVIKKIRSLEEGFADVNSVRYALTGGIYSRSPSHIERAKREMEVGNLYINRSITGAVVERHPFGGFKLSGIGSKAGGPDYLYQFLEPRTYSENTVRRGFAGD